jgi:hypothetical protein
MRSYLNVSSSSVMPYTSQDNGGKSRGSSKEKAVILGITGLKMTATETFFQKFFAPNGHFVDKAKKNLKNALWRIGQRIGPHQGLRD